MLKPCIGDFESFYRGYLEVSLTMGEELHQEDPEPRDCQGGWCLPNIDLETEARLKQECLEFFEKAGGFEKDLGFLVEHPLEQAGENFYLTRNDHSTGFWDGGWPMHGAALTELAYCYKEAYLYVGRDGKIYASHCS